MSQTQQNEFAFDHSPASNRRSELGDRSPLPSTTLRLANDFRGFQVLADGNPFGAVRDVLFDDTSYICRYLGVLGDEQLESRPLLISPLAVSHPDWELRTFPTVLSQPDVAASPLLEPDQPITRRQEIAIASHFNWPEYWGYSPAVDLTQSGILRKLSLQEEAPDQSPRLRGLAECLGYRIEYNQTALGFLDDVIIDTETWVLRYLVVDTEDHLSNGRTLISLNWVTDIAWNELRINVDLAEDLILKAPVFDKLAPLSRDYENQLFEHYQRAKYW